MQEQILLNDKPAYKIKATRRWQTDKAILLNCQGSEHWFPLSDCEYNHEEKTAIISEFMYNLKFGKNT